jgi:DNA-binding TFAR19-related protein (PDSD5 family)
MASSGMLRRVALVRTDVSEELSASIIRMTRIGELGTTIAVTSNRRSLRRNTKYQILHSISSQRASVASYS